MSAAASTFEGRKVLVSGSSSGIGRAIAVALGRQGAELILVGRDRDRLDATAAESGSGATSMVLDLSRLEDIVPAVRTLTAEKGRIYGLCHAAGTVDTAALTACKPEKLEAMLGVNYLSGMELARAVCRRDVMDPEGGAILFIGSIYASVGMPGQIAYSGSKGAVLAAARAMAIEVARRAIRVNVLSPGMVRSEMTEKAFLFLSGSQMKSLEDAHPLGFGTPEDVAEAAAFLLSPASRWITGTNLVVDGGRSAH